MSDSPDAVVGEMNEEKDGGCPFDPQRAPRPTEGGDNTGWWPNRLNLKILAKNPVESNPMGDDFDYAAEFESLDLEAVKRDIAEVLTTSQDWWPADYGNYGPLMIRMAWHSAGTYRISDGRGGAGAGQQRFAPLNSWPDNANLDKARRLLWPVKSKYGRKLSWADLMVLTGNVALEQMGFETFGFAGGREDVWEPDEDVYWGPETEWLGDARYTGDRDLENPLAAVQMGLIYVNPEGPNANPDPAAAAVDIRETFAPHGDERRGDRRADRRRPHLRQDPRRRRSRRVRRPRAGGGSARAAGPRLEQLERQRRGRRGHHQRPRGRLDRTRRPKWDNSFFEILFGHEWELVKSPAGASQWKPKDGGGEGTVPDAHKPDVTHQPTMLTTDLALRVDPDYERISRRFLESPDELADAFARAWFKLTHRDMGPIDRYLGPEVPEEELLWQDPIPERDGAPLGDADIADLKERIASSDLSVSQLVSTAWAAASSFRGSDKRGGANGGRIRLEPQRSWAVNEPDEAGEGAERPGGDPGVVQLRAPASRSRLADLVVLGGSVGVEQAAKAAGHDVEVPFTAGRADASQEQTDVDSFAALEPTVDGFRNYDAGGHRLPAEYMLVDRANLLTLTAPEMTVLVGGLRVLGANHGGSPEGVFTKAPETLTNDFFVNLLDLSTKWSATEDSEWSRSFEARNGSADVKWTGSRVDLVFGSNSELRALAEVYASEDAERSSSTISWPPGSRS